MASANVSNLPLKVAQAYFTGTWKFMLVTDAPSESDLDTWDTRSDVTTEHAATGGYTAGGFTVTIDSITLDTTNNRAVVTFSADNPTLTDVTLSGVVGGFLYKAVGTAATDELATFVDYGSAKDVTAGNFTHTFTTPLYINR